MRYTVLTVVVLVALSGCGLFSNTADEPGTAIEREGPRTAEVDEPGTATPSPTATQEEPSRIPNSAPSLPPSATGDDFLPYSSELPIEGYLRVNENTSNEVDSPRLAVATRYFERTDAVSEARPSQVSATVILYESTRAARSDIEAQIDTYQTDTSSVFVNSTPVDVPIVQIVRNEEGRSISLIQYGRAGVMIECRGRSNVCLSFTDATGELILLRLEN